jgi:DNA-binding protein HU-beta
MNKTELIQSLSEEVVLNKKDVIRLLDALTRTIIRTLRKGDKLQWSGFGTFILSHRRARLGINPATKEKINLKETHVPKFRPSKTLKQLIR